MVEKFDKFDEWLTICQTFSPTKLFNSYVFAVRPTITQIIRVLFINFL